MDRHSLIPIKACEEVTSDLGLAVSFRRVLYNWLIWRVLKMASFFKKCFPCIYFGVWSSQNNAIFM